MFEESVTFLRVWTPFSSSSNTGVNYPKRDPNLKDNWRGRNRTTSDDNETDTFVFETHQTENCKDEEPAQEEWNYQALRNAMHKGMSFWRSHTDCKCSILFLLFFFFVLAHKRYFTSSSSLFT